MNFSARRWQKISVCSVTIYSPGWTSATRSGAWMKTCGQRCMRRRCIRFTGGFDTEELETWRARVIERYYWTPQGGADGDYVVWAKEVPGITRAWTYRHWMGTGTVGVMIASSDLINPIPEESTETAARQHIVPLAPVAGSDLYVFRPVAHTVDFHIRVTPDTPEIRAAITAELRSFLLRDGYPQGELKVSRISEAISGANGEYSHQLLAPADNISIAKNELAVLGTISWT